ncbi:MAG: YIP1 family protein [Pseudomonadota bacterium]
MIVELFRRMVEGLFSPRRSARALLAQKLGLDTAVQFAVLAYCLTAMLGVLVPGIRDDEALGNSLPIGSHVLSLIAQVMMVGIIGMAIWGIGTMFGGKGSREQAMVLVGWHTLVTTLLAPLFLFGTAAAAGGEPGELPVAVVFVFAVAVSQYLWVLACYTMELHGFRSPWGVLGVMVAVAMLFSTAVLSFVGTTGA